MSYLYQFSWILLKTIESIFGAFGLIFLYISFYDPSAAIYAILLISVAAWIQFSLASRKGNRNQ